MVIEVAVAVDAGGTKLLGGLVTREGAVLAEAEVPTPRAPEGCDPGLRATARLVDDLARRAAADGHRVVGVGVGFPEYVRDDVVSSREVFAWDRQPADVLAEVVPGVPVRVDGDVRCAAVAEARRRAPADGALWCYVSWGTGLSSTVLLGERPLAGRRGEALALGEWPVVAAVDPTWRGTLEAYAAGRALGLRYAERTGDPVDGRTVIARAASGGDPVASDVVDSAATAVAHALAQVVQLLDPDLLVLGGGLGTSGTRPPTLVAELLPTLLHRPDPPRVEAALEGSRAGLVGAGLVGAGLLGAGLLGLGRS